ncbi:MAG: helix-turn-helix domain-containing protein [Tannerellaceae bacterium]
MKRFLFCLFLLTLFYPIDLLGQQNSFLQFAGKPYASYHYALRDTLRQRYESNDIKVIRLTVQQMQALPDKFKDHQWQLEAAFFEANYMHDYQQGDSAQFVSRMKQIREESRSCGNKVFETRVMRRLFDLEANRNIPQSLLYARALERLLEQITSQEFPDLVDYKFQLATLYLQYNDCVRAEKYFKMVVEAPLENSNQRIFVHSRNNLGIIQRNYYKDLDKSDYWFNSILDFNRQIGIKEAPLLWNAIAKGNIGQNKLARNQYKEALPLMLLSFDVMYDAHDYSYAYGMATSIATCYCEMNDYTNALKYIHFSDSCYKSIAKDQKASLERLYVAFSKYYVGIGDSERATIYMDSAFLARDASERIYSLDKILRTEQMMNSYELKEKTEESQFHLNLFRMILIAASLLTLVLICSIILYLKKKKEYKRLVLQSQQWAIENSPYHVAFAAAIPPVSDQPSRVDLPKDNTAIGLILDYMESSMCYNNPNLSLDILAKELRMNRTSLSNAINSTDDSFNVFINKYRIKSAIRILSTEADQSIENLAIQVGFNNRKSFYNAFKTITGLSPSQFKNNLKQTVA